MDERSIGVEGLVKSFPGGVTAVNGVSFTVQLGEVFGFLGPNGAGKSTTIQVLTTLLLPTRGQVQVAGYDVVAQPAAVRRAVGVALQDIGLDPLMTGRELLQLQGRLFGLRAAAARQHAAELLALVGLEAAADRRTRTYSGGMRRRLDLALALVHGPRLLFLDEPTAGLDPASRAGVWEEVRRLNGTGVTVFLTTQYLEEADRLAGRLAIIDRGRLVATGTPGELKAALGGDAITLRFAEPGAVERARSVLGEGSRPADPAEPVLLVYRPHAAAVVPEIVRRLVAAVSGAGSAGQALVRDLETRYFTKLLLTPVSRAALVLGPILAGALQLGVQVVLIEGLALALGLRSATGPAGLLVVLALALLWGLAFAGYSVAVALRTGNGQAAQAATFVFFPLIFLSTTFVPKELLSAEWMKVAATLNPTTYVLEAMRAVLLQGWQVMPLLEGVAAGGAFALATALFAILSTRRATARG